MDRRDFLKKTVTVAGGIAASRLLGETNVLAAGRSISNTDPIMDYATLNNGIRMPILGYGTLRIPVERCAECVSEAIRKGWRLIDTAKNYEVGKGIRQSGIDRSEVFITSKIAPDAMRSGKVRESLDRTIEAFGGTYVDLMLIHWPVAGKVEETWKIMEEYVDAGKIRAIGVSNFNPHHVDELLEYRRHCPKTRQKHRAGNPALEHPARSDCHPPVRQCRLYGREHGYIRFRTLARGDVRHQRAEPQRAYLREERPR